MVALTGGIGSGKSAVADLLVEAGVEVVDTDILARQVVQAPGPVFDAIVGRFGPAVVDGAGQLDRKVLARLVFADHDARDDLNAVVHPAVAREVARRLAAPDNGGGTGGAGPVVVPVVVVVPLLVEAGWADRFDAVVVVDCPEDLALARLVATRAMSPDEVRARMAAQTSREGRRAVADHVITNDGTVEQLARQVRELRVRHLGGRVP